jgi:5'(3')-deoxyribonucleotidase
MDEQSFVFGVDLDGVVGDFYSQMRKIAAEWMDKQQNELTPDVSYGLREWGIDEYGGYDRLHRFAVTQKGLFRRMKPIKDAPKILRHLSGCGIRIRIITHRLFLKYSHCQTITQTVEWLDRWDIPYWDICFMQNKDKVAANIYIDDSPENILKLRGEGVSVIIFSNSTNAGLDGQRAENWEEVGRLVLAAKAAWEAP